jgi:hypothetical protein
MHIIIIDKISMLTNVMLYAIKQCLKQPHGKSNPFVNMLLLLIGDLAQLLVICKHAFKKKEIHYKKIQ